VRAASPTTPCCGARSGSSRTPGSTSSASRLLRKVRELRPDVVIAGIRMTPTHVDEGLQAARRIRGEFPGIEVLMLSHYVEGRRAAGRAQ
jgi:DNA-binding NarL/FixJ family response regulator